MSRATRFLVLLVVYVAAGNVLLFVPVVKTRVIEPWTRFTALAAASVASGVGVESEAIDTMVVSGPASLDIAGGCDGVHALVILLSSILAYPASWRQHLLGVALGSMSILGINLLRILNLIVVARYHPSWLKLFHVAIWETLIMLFALALFLTWWRFVAVRRSRPLEAEPA